MSVLDVDKETFEPEVLQAEGTVLVDFYGDGCVPCAALMPHVHEFAETYGDKIKFTSLNTTKARRLAIGQKVLGLPVNHVRPQRVSQGRGSGPVDPLREELIEVDARGRLNGVPELLGGCGLELVGGPVVQQRLEERGVPAPAAGLRAG